MFECWKYSTARRAQSGLSDAGKLLAGTTRAVCLADDVVLTGHVVNVMDKPVVFSPSAAVYDS